MTMDAAGRLFSFPYSLSMAMSLVACDRAWRLVLCANAWSAFINLVLVACFACFPWQQWKGQCRGLVHRREFPSRKAKQLFLAPKTISPDPPLPHQFLLSNFFAPNPNPNPWSIMGNVDTDCFQGWQLCCTGASLESTNTSPTLGVWLSCQWKIDSLAKITSMLCVFTWQRWRWPWRPPGQYGASTQSTRPMAASSGFAQSHQYTPSGGVPRVVSSRRNGHCNCRWFCYVLLHCR